MLIFMMLNGFHVDVSYDAQSHPRLQLSDFELVKKIGQGGFGEVYVCRKKDTKEVLALKIVNKSLIWKKNKVTQMKNERDVLASNLPNSWMVQLAYSFQDPHRCYLAMEYCPGGDLRHLLAAYGYLEEDEARLYMAEMIFAVFTLHQLGYIHRDLKPDNFLIDSTGHLKLTDFGLSKDGLHSHVVPNRNTNPSSTPSITSFTPVTPLSIKHGLGSLSNERRISGEKFEEDAAQRPPIHLCSIAIFTTQYFRTHIIR